MKLYIWNNYHNGDIIFTIPLVQHVLDIVPDVKIAWGIFKNQSYLVKHLPIQVLESEHTDQHAHNLEYLCPEDYTKIYMWLGQYDDTRHHIWKNVVKVFNRQCQENQINLKVTKKTTPMVSFNYPNITAHIHSAYVENGFPRSGHSYFNFDMNKISNTFPHINFYCTADPNCDNRNVYNCGNLNLVELAALSNKCEMLMGKGSGPICCTFTDENKSKPRAIMGYNTPHGKSFWDYDNSPIQYLYTEEELFRFIEESHNQPRMNIYR